VAAWLLLLRVPLVLLHLVAAVLLLLLLLLLLQQLLLHHLTLRPCRQPWQLRRPAQCLVPS
jgi:hypothetical protein